MAAKPTYKIEIMLQVQVVVLDLDGVIVKSNLIKYRAMLALFTAFPAHSEVISTFILANGGVPRQEKLTAILAEILGLQVTPALIADYLQRYDHQLADLLRAVPLVEGVADFVASGDYHCYVSSSAPEAEVESHLVRTALRPHFAAIFGRSTPKATALTTIKQRHPGATVVFFGDAVGDLRAAQVANVPFIGVICERDNFGGYDVVKLQDFSDKAAVQQCIDAAIGSGYKWS